MTNEEKSKEIADKTDCIHQYVGDALYNACLQMAEWKDEQYKQLLIDAECRCEELQAKNEELEQKTKLLTTCNVDKSRLAQEYRKGYNDGLKHYNKLESINEELNAELGNCYDRIVELVAKIKELEK